VRKTIENTIQAIGDFYDEIQVDRYIIMPNHVHLIIVIKGVKRQIAAPTISVIIGNMKRKVSIRLGFSPWQKSFHDHIIRNERDYMRIVEYIDNNPAKWEYDCFYTIRMQ